MSITDNLRWFWPKVMDVKNREHKGVLRQIFEIVRHKIRNPTLGATDYYVFRLHSSNILQRQGATEFIGWRCEMDLAEVINNRTTVLPAWDKLSFHLYANAFGIPVPRIIATFRPKMSGEWHSIGTLIEAPAELACWLRNNQHWPIFAKPSYSQATVGAYKLVGYREENDSLVTSTGEQFQVDSFVADVVLSEGQKYFKREMGYLFQEVLRPHGSLAKLVGNSTISGIRVVVIQDEGCPEIIAAVWKIARGLNHTDAWMGRESGHLMAPVDLATGKVGAAINGLEPRLYDKNPDNGEIINGFVMPHWEKAKYLCLQAASMFPLIRIQHWDLAITDSGPCLLEVNDVGSIPFVQMFGTGLLTPRLRNILRKYGDPKRFPWISRLPR